MKITVKVQKFIEGVLEGKTQADAYRASFACNKMTPKQVISNASEIACRPEVARMIAHLNELRQKNSLMAVRDVLTEYVALATADIQEIVQHRRLCCRFCHGVNHQYQWRNADEFNEAKQLHDDAVKDFAIPRQGPRKKPGRAPSNVGGYGFRFNMPPSDECPMCLGEGKADVYIADTTKLKGPARRLIQSIKQTQHGVEIKFRSQDGHLENIGKLLGGFKQTFVFQDADGNTVQPALILPLDASDAARQYAEIMKGASNAKKT